MTTLPHSERHPVAALARQVRDDLTSVAEVPLWSMAASEAAAAMVLLTRARSQLEELLMRVLRHAESVDVGADVGMTTATWWAHETGVTRAEARRTARLAEAMEHHEDVARALTLGDLRIDQARVIVDAVDGLPDEVEAWVPPAATEFLMGKATEHDARALRVLGRRVLEVIDPVAADAEEARRLQTEESDARATASFTMVDDRHGRCHGRFSIPTLHSEMLRKHLLALTAQSRAAAPPTDRTLTRHRMGLAFMDYLETRPEGTLPSSGGVPATVVVTMELEALLGGLGAASLDTGGRIVGGHRPLGRRTSQWRPNGYFTVSNVTIRFDPCPTSSSANPCAPRWVATGARSPPCPPSTSRRPP